MQNKPKLSPCNQAAGSLWKRIHASRQIVNNQDSQEGDAVFLYIYNTINTRSLQRLNFIHQIAFTCLKSQSPPSPLRNSILDVPKLRLYLWIVELSKKKKKKKKNRTHKHWIIFSFR